MKHENREESGGLAVRRPFETVQMGDHSRRTAPRAQIADAVYKNEQILAAPGFTPCTLLFIPLQGLGYTRKKTSRQDGTEVAL